jgi:Ca2+-binding RTX toxin-like protein
MAVELEPLDLNFYPEPSIVTVYRIDVATGSVWSFQTETYNGSFRDVSVLSDGMALLTQNLTGGSSGQVVMQLLNPMTGQYSDANAMADSGAVMAGTTDGEYTLFAEGGTAAGLHIYQAGVGVVASNFGGDGTGRPNTNIHAINAEAGLAVRYIYEGALQVFDLDLQLQVDLMGSHPEWALPAAVSALAFDESGQYLFVLDNNANEIVQLSTSDWSVVDEIPLGFDLQPLYHGAYGNLLIVGPDARYFTVVTDDGLMQVDNPSVSSTITGTNASETITGTALFDELLGAGGDDLLVALAGNDILSGGDGNERLDGGAGDDRLDGGAGIDTADYSAALGEVRVDLNFAVPQNTGWAGTDTLLSIENVIGGAYGDFLTGDSNANLLSGRAGSDQLTGGGGNDILDGGSGLDLLFGGTGDDIYIFNGDGIFENAGEGTDEVRAYDYCILAENVENLRLMGTVITGEGNALDNIIRGNDTGNVLHGVDGSDKLYGYGGDDALNGGNGDDYLYGLTGNDWLIGGGGYDRMYGGVGDDIYYVNDPTDFAYELAGEGTDHVHSTLDHQLRDHVENLTLTGTAVIGKGNAADNGITGNDMNNRLYGYGGNDVIDGRYGDDIIDGREGNDTLTGWMGYDKMYGGTGDDTFIVADATDFCYENAGEGYDRVIASVSHTLRINIEGLELSGTDDIRGYGNASDNLIIGNSGANLLNGRDGNDALLGNDGNDLLYGENGKDSLDGGAGQDRYYGGTGADSFFFDDGDFAGLAGATADRIMDFSQLDGDKIDLVEVDANTGLAGDQGFSFIGTGAFTGAAGELRTFQAGGMTYLQGDTNGDGAADFLIRVDGLHTLGSSDFVI